MTILVVEDEEVLRDVLVTSLRKRGHDVDGARGDQDLPRTFPANRYDVVLLDLKLSGSNGLSILSRIRESCPETLVIIMTAFGGTEAALEALRSGAHDFLEKPFSLTILELRLERALKEVSLRRANSVLRNQLDISSEELVGRDPRMVTLRESLIRFSAMDSPVLLVGETGTGRKTAARSLIAYSNRREAPFYLVDCATMSPRHLLETLTGMEQGGASGIFSTQRGIIECGDGGTIYLDEVDQLKPDLQECLLKLIETGEIVRQGGDHPVRVNVRILAATRQDLAALVKKGQFRKDLYFRLTPLTLAFPPLWQRIGDLGILAETILSRLGADLHRRLTLSPGAFPLMERYSWPGNLRELKNVLERMSVYSRDGLLLPEHLPREFRDGLPAPLPSVKGGEEGGLREELLMEERRRIGQILEAVRGNRTQAAKILGMKRSSLNYRLRKLGLSMESPGQENGKESRKAGNHD